jgi:hypothetical protein
MVTLAQATPAPDAKAPKKDSKKALTKLGKMNERLLYVQELAKARLVALDGQADRLDEKSKARPLVEEAYRSMEAAVKSLDAVGKLFYRLVEVKWEPSSGAKSFRAGDVVSLKPNRTERFTKHGAYPIGDLKNMTVVSVHGAEAKIQSPKKEALGLVPLSWLVAGDK